MTLFFRAGFILLLSFSTQVFAFPFDQKQVLTDSATLLTLEEGENETFPYIQPDAPKYGQKFLVSSWAGKKHPAISLRVLENGDPLHSLIENDVIAVQSFGWKGNDHLYFLSTRASSIGVWTIAADGQGAIHRLHHLHGHWTQVALLADGSLLAVKIPKASNKQSSSSSHKRKRGDMNFYNWKVQGGTSHIIHINTDAEETVLAEGINPTISKDGKKVVFAMASGRSMHLFSMDTNGDNLTQLTHSRSIDAQPTWSDDGQMIAFTSNRGNADMRHGKGNWDIWLMDAEGNNLRRITRDPAKDGAPAFVGQDLLFHSDRKVSSEEKKDRGIHKSTAGFHIWRISSKNNQGFRQ